MISHAAVFLLSAATLAFEINLSRVFSVSQFHHFAFMTISIALLGFGASGSLLAILNRAPRRLATGSLHLLCCSFALTAVGSYAFTLCLPFDSFRIAYDWRQGLVLALHYFALATPFFFSGAVVGVLLEMHRDRAAQTYAANLIGSSAGCLVALGAPALMGAEGTVLLSSSLGLLAAVLFYLGSGRRRPGWQTALQLGAAALLLMGAVNPPAALRIKLSPYKDLSYALLNPDSELVFQQWNSFSRVDLVSSEAIHSLPGRGFVCTSAPPSQLGLTVDGDDLSPITHVTPGFGEAPFTDCLLTALPYRLRPDGQALILEPRGGLDVLVALGQGATRVTAAEANPLVIQAVHSQGDWAGCIYDDARVEVVAEEGRSYTRRAEERFDVVQLSLTTPYRPVASGAYSLAEDYRYTVEAFEDYVAALKDRGLLVVTRWLQIPPSEAVRAFALTVEALERSGEDPKESVVALRSYRQMLILARRGAFTAAELQQVRDFSRERAFDLVYIPGIQPDEPNQHNRMASPIYYETCLALIDASARSAGYQGSSFDIRPPRDDWPFFGHYFTWRQASDVLAMAGHVWLPFGGAGYFVLLALLALAGAGAAVLVFLPLAARPRPRGTGPSLASTLAYFALLGFGFLFVEIPLLQRFILFLGHPSYAFAAVLFGILLFSGLGSLLSSRLQLRAVLLALPVLVALYAVGLPLLFEAGLGAPLWLRALVAVAALAPPGLLMGMPFPRGLALLGKASDALVAWAWGVNGALSVVASILAALVALSVGFTAVLGTGAACYLAACLLAPRVSAPGA
jgi:hypothetical protein